MSAQIDLSRYHDLSQRIGDRDDLELVGGKPVLDDGEVELARIAGAVDLFGPRSPGENQAPSLGLVLQCAATIVLTGDRLLMLGFEGHETHTFVLPWDLVDVISMPLRRKMSDRVAGNRTIELFAGLPLITLRIVPQSLAEIFGVERSVTDDGAMALLARAAAGHRVWAGGPEEVPRLEAIIRGAYTHDGGIAEAWITARDIVGTSPHLHGRLVERDRST